MSQGEAWGERLYRATVGLVWYFSWFNVSEGRSLRRTLLYHAFILSDIATLCGLWFWRENPDVRSFNREHLIAVVCVVLVYLLGLSLKTFYYRRFHPNVSKDELKTAGEEPALMEAFTCSIHVRTEEFGDETDSPAFRSAPTTPASRGRPTEPRKVNKRMMKLANNFYS